jgi:hypothetical protein
MTLNRVMDAGLGQRRAYRTMLRWLSATLSNWFRLGDEITSSIAEKLTLPHVSHTTRWMPAVRTEMV